MSFPASPVLNEVFIADGKAWKFDGTNWVIPKKASTLPWELVTGKPTYFPADWSSTVANIPDYFNAKVISSEFPPTNQATGTLWWDETNKRLYVYQSNVWVETSAAFREKFITIDPDVINYVTAVETADGAPLEQEVVTAYEAFIRGCKIDGIWNSIKASCILAGARTIAGATTPLKGLNPNYGTLSNYNRKTGYLGGGFNFNRNNNVDPQNNRHISIFITEPSFTTGVKVLIGNGYPYSGATNIIASDSYSPNYIVSSSSGNQNTAIAGAIGVASNVLNTSIGFLGISRNNSNNFVFRANSVNETIVNMSSTPRDAGLVLSTTNVNSSAGTQRSAFYCVGESIDLAKLDARVTKLMTTLSTVIP